MGQDDERERAETVDKSGARAQDRDLCGKDKEIKHHRRGGPPKPEGWDVSRRNRYASQQAHENYQVTDKHRWHQIQRGTERWVHSELFGSPATIGHQHPHERPQVRARAALHFEARIIKQLSSALLDLVHEGVFFVWIKLFIETAEFEHHVPTRDAIAQDQFP